MSTVSVWFVHNCHCVGCVIWSQNPGAENWLLTFRHLVHLTDLGISKRAVWLRTSHRKCFPVRLPYRGRSAVQYPVSYGLTDMSVREVRTGLDRRQLGLFTWGFGFRQRWWVRWIRKTILYTMDNTGLLQLVARHPASRSPVPIAVPKWEPSRSRWRNQIFSIWFRGLFCFCLSDGIAKKPESFLIKDGLVFNDFSKIWIKPELDQTAGARPFLNRFVIRCFQTRYAI